MLIRLAIASAIAAAGVLAAPALAGAQDNFHWPRQHAVPPLSQTVPGAAATPRSPTERRKRAEQTTGEIIDDDAGGYTYDTHGFEANVGVDGRVHFRDKLPISGEVLVTPVFLFVFGSFDATEIVMQAVGEDPYSYQKAKFLERTFKSRTRMRMRNDRLVMARAIRTLPDYLGRVWSYQGWDSSLRKRVLFALWDECAEQGNDLLVRGGAEARAVIEGYIRRELPADGPHGFSTIELSALNRIRGSTARFDPYRSAR